jgi:hypothetical protein
MGAVFDACSRPVVESRWAPNRGAVSVGMGADDFWVVCAVGGRVLPRIMSREGAW